MVIDDKNGHCHHHLYFPREPKMGSPQKMVIPFLLSISIVYVDHININKAEKPKLANCTLLHFITEKAMAPVLQYSCLENPMDGGAW